MFGFPSLSLNSLFVLKSIKKVIRIPNMDLCNNHALSPRKNYTNSSESVSAMKPRRQNVGVGLTISRRVTRSMTKLQPNSFPIPDELVFEIFSRLPSKTIARCRCACKLWSSMLRRQDFTDSFLTKSCARPQLLFACEDDSKYIFFSSPQPENPEENSYVVASNHLARFPSSYSLFGCTYGFLCFGANMMLNCDSDEMIWNPSTGQSLTLPRLNSRLRVGVDSYLGYDPVAKQLKVLSMNRSVASGELFSVEHQVLTLGTKNLSWRLVECCVPHFSCRKWICIGGVLYYTASVNSSSFSSMVVCFDLRSEKFRFVNFMETFSRAMDESTTLVNYDGRLVLLMSEDSSNVTRSSKSFDLWVLQDDEWSKHVYVLPPSWKDVVTEIMCISGMVGTSEIVLSPRFQYVPSYVMYYNVESKTIRKVGIQGLEAFQGSRFYTYLNYVENVKFL
ncbi:putative F-box protein At2g19630 isoform X1 [Brassica napus]|uniref:putative F-box protein At2g19630 isoform X1 n=1 Tax=Brassica napus TaxID=3708 RepID=UPI00207A558C|nr:putative F-box protein At2g19630 isoform X1 [Brassica napus]XP_048610026.1 putative F-box protein At2g19630 isoform X1 [Brassica napus]XP_048610027.1 putative F-box protein At2g19630 isoform X1 [Brassica napus]XP_048610028.1 putative F-box protein At2g19630 isoform X1 [Brassica napus]